jgi:hypothetical protein
VGGAALVGAVLVWPETRRQTISLLQQVRELWGRPPKQEM